MNKRILITTPFPSLDDTARELGISKSDQKKVEKLVEEIIAARTPKPAVRMRKGLDSRQRDKNVTAKRQEGADSLGESPKTRKLRA